MNKAEALADAIIRLQRWQQARLGVREQQRIERLRRKHQPLKKEKAAA
jgi:hypothetical protein